MPTTTSHADHHATCCWIERYRGGECPIIAKGKDWDIPIWHCFAVELVHHDCPDFGIDLKANRVEPLRCRSVSVHVSRKQPVIWGWRSSAKCCHAYANIARKRHSPSVREWSSLQPRRLRVVLREPKPRMMCLIVSRRGDPLQRSTRLKRQSTGLHIDSQQASAI